MKNFTKKAIIFVLGWLLIANISVATAWAHASYVRSDPPAGVNLPSGQPPGKIQVWFSERLEPKFSELQVFDSQQHRVDNNDSRVLSNDQQAMSITLKSGLADGPYTVVYKTASAEDGHVLKNSFAFVVGAGAVPAPGTANLPATQAIDDNFNVWSVVWRWLNYLGSAALIGGVGWWLLVWKPAQKKIQAKLGPEQSEAGQVAERRGKLLLNWAGGVLLIGWLGFFLYQATRFSGLALPELITSSALFDFLFSSRFGLVWLVRLGLLVVVGLLLLALNGKLVLPGAKLSRTRFNLVPETEPPASPVAPVAVGTGEAASTGLVYWLLLGAGALVLLTTSLTSHAAATEMAWAMVPLDWLHLLSTGFWVGGLFYFALAMPSALAKLRPGTGDRTRLLAGLISNFTFLSIISVSLLLISGVIQAAVHLGAVSDLFDTGYGLALFVKLIAVALMLLLGAYHFLKVGPEMKNFARRKSESNGAGSMAAGALQFRFRQTVMVEAGLAVLLLGIVGGLTSFGPPAGANSASGLVLRGQAGDLNYLLQVDPGQLGNNNFSLTLTDASGVAINKTAAVYLQLSMTEMEMGTQVIDLKPVPDKPGLFQAQGQILSMAGQWRGELVVQRDGKEDARSQLDFKIKTS